MAVKLVRKSSEVPNITNRDDAMMARYAYGGYTGIVKGFGTEASISIDGSKATIGSGRIVVNGWEVDIEGDGYEIIHSSASSLYYSVILTINLVTETASFRVASNSGAYPEISEGDDLTAYPNGIKEIVTHRIRSSGSVFVECSRVMSVIPYLTSVEKSLSATITSVEKSLSATITSVEKSLSARLNSLGFKEGEVTIYAVTSPTTGTATKISINESYKGRVYLYKQGKMALLKISHIYNSFSSLPSGTTIIRYTFPSEFRPASSVTNIVGKKSVYDPLTYTYTDYAYETDIGTMSSSDGSILPYIDLPSLPNRNTSYYITNLGWRIY